MSIGAMLDFILDKNVLLSIFYLMIIIVMMILRKKEKNKVVLILGIITLFVGLMHFLVFNIHYFKYMMEYFKQIYIVSFVIFIVSLFRKNKIVFRILSIVAIICSLYGIYKTVFIVSALSPFHNYSYYGYKDSVVKLLDTLEKEYPLNDWKQIDYNYLRTKYIPMAEEAEKENDQVLFYETVTMIGSEFKDGHVGVSLKIDESFMKLASKFDTNYFGFFTIMADNEEIVAVMVDKNSDAYQKGLRDGSVITKIDGRSASNILENEYYWNVSSIAVRKNEKLLNSDQIIRSINDTIEVTFLNEDNKEVVINVHSEDYDTLYSPTYFVLKSQETENLYTKMLTDDIGYINITSENYNSFMDTISAIIGDSAYTRNIITKKLDELNDQGMKKLVIDLRDNGGGSIINANAFASPFLDKTFKYAKTKIELTGEYLYQEVKGTGKYANIPIVVLVSENTGSAGDIMAYLLKNNHNVKVMGFMPSSNSAQYAGGTIYLTNGVFFSYPGGRDEDLDGNPLIDTKKDGIETIKLDIKIPITKENVMDIINTNMDGDYVLDYAINYLKN